MSSLAPPKTLVEALQLSLTAALRSAEGVSEPAALMWTDADGQWRPLLPALRVLLPHIYSLGIYDPQNHGGPAI